MEYNSQNTIALAKRINNTKRSFLIVNPLQAKHIAVSPTAALEMMTALADKLYDSYRGRRVLVIGFAETATAISAVCAKAFDGAAYITTTREHLGEDGFTGFLEEHSHAAEQCIYSDFLLRSVSDGCVIIFVDDELSTGRTLLNIIGATKKQLNDRAENVTLAAASIINRMSAADLDRFRAAGVQTHFLVRADGEDFDTAVADCNVSPAPVADDSFDVPALRSVNGISDPRFGVSAEEYVRSCHALSQKIISELDAEISSAESVLVMGTEECMYPAIYLGSETERRYKGKTVRTHSTTRSPIGILGGRDGYPIQSGYSLASFYDKDRTTFIYNTAEYDMVIVVTDSRDVPDTALRRLNRIFGGKVVVYRWTE